MCDLRTLTILHAREKLNCVGDRSCRLSLREVGAGLCVTEHGLPSIHVDVGDDPIIVVIFVEADALASPVLRLSIINRCLHVPMLRGIGLVQAFIFEVGLQGLIVKLDRWRSQLNLLINDLLA